MAATGEEVANEKLNFAFKILGERGKEGESWKEYTEHVTSYVLKQLSELLNKNSDNCIRFQPYGSAAEDLKCLQAGGVGDVDIMIFPDSDNLMILDELLEYSLENPLHVKIKGRDHPVLQSCLVEDTEYVPTSALKGFHPAIYGSSSPYLADLVTRAFQFMSREDVSRLVQCSTQLKNSTTSPATTLNFAQSFGTISEQLEMMKDPQNLPNLDPTEWEWFAHYLCTARGVDYTRQHAELLNDLMKFSNEVHMSLQEKGLPVSSPQAFSVVIQELLWSDKAQELKARLRTIESGTQPNKTGRERENERMDSAAVNNNYSQFVTPECQCDGNESGRDEDSCLRETSPFHGGPCLTEANCGEGRSTIGELESTLSNATAPNNNCCEMSSRQATFKSDADNKSDEKSTGEYSENVNGGTKEWQPLAQKGELTSQDLPHNANDKGDDEKRELQRKIRNRWLDHLFGKAVVEANRTPTQETKSKYAETAQLHERVGGIDFVPALRSRGWPKVARDWIKRGRKWPLPDVVDKVIQEGFHLVVKPPKTSRNPGLDFRISFSHAEYLLSQEMNDFQRECYRCLKKYHRAYLSTQPASLVTFHLKNILLQTIEVTGGEMWTESNRVECMMKLLGNLLEALTKKDLRHFFVRSYNLFGVDYIEDPKTLESLAEKVEQIMENPLQYSNMLIKTQEDTKQDKTEGSVPSKDRQAKHEEILPQGIAEIDCKDNSTVTMQKTEATQTSSPRSYRYHDLKEIFLNISNELIDMAFNDSNLRVENLDSLERSLVEGLREIVSNHDIAIEELPKLFNSSWDIVYYKVWISSEPDMRRRMLGGIQGQVEMWKYMVKQEDFASGNEAAIVNRMLDPSTDDPFDLSHIIPADGLWQFFSRFIRSLDARPAHVQFNKVDDIPLD